ncbi:MAG TPA: LPD38 domain-containing protein [Thermoanaerobaculia bacterium]|nr:LPD38 domain-containing protein [Thermoanaerobaculia bacterium]
MIKLYPEQPSAPASKKIRLFNDTPPAPPASTTVPKANLATKVSTPIPAGAPTSTDPYFRGKGYGASNITDTSGKPLLTFKNETAKQSQLLLNRVATTWDPTVPQKIDRKMLVNGRVPQEVTDAIRKELGAGYDDELDHRIALSLSGSNQKTNLGLEPGRTTKGRAIQLNTLVNRISKQVSTGQISLLEGQRRIAEAKGVELPDVGAKGYEAVPVRTTAPAGVPETSPFKVNSSFRSNEAFRTPLPVERDPSTIPAPVRKAGGVARDVAAGVFADPADAKNDPRISNNKKMTPFALGVGLGMIGPLDDIAKGPKAVKNLVTKADDAFDAAKYVAKNVAEREAARGPGPKVFEGVGSFLSLAKRKLVDFAAPIEDVLADTLKKTKTTLRPSEHITNQIDRVLRAPAIAGQFVRDGGLEAVIKEAPDLDALDQYLIAKHTRTVAANGLKTGRDLASDTRLIETLGPEYEGLAKTVTAYSQKLLDYSVDSGLISKELATKLKEIYPDYVPLQRIFADDEVADLGFGGGKAIASLSKQTIVQKLTGSTREIASPIESLMAKTSDAFRQGEKNKAARILASYKDLPGNPFSLRELPKGESAPHTISYLDDGVKRTFETSKEIAEAAKALNVQQMNILGKILALPVRVAKLGITGINVPFVASNIIKDQVGGFINSNRALATSVANPANFIKALFSAVKHDELYEELVREGAGGTSFDIARDQVPATIGKIRASRSAAGRVLYTVKHPSELLRTAEDIIGRSEELTRLQQYRGSREAFIKEGMSKDEAKIAAAKAARENTVNFARRGEWGTVLNSAFLYLNAGIQGTRTLVRSASTRPVQTAAKIATAVFMPVSIVTAWNMRDPERREAYEDIAPFERENNIVIVPPNPTKDEQGRWNVIKIPLAQGVNNLSSIPRRAIEQAFGHDDVRASELADLLIGSVSPVSPDKGSVLSAITPQAIKPSLEVGVNKNFFTGRDIVSPYMKNKPAEEQVYDYTSGSARRIAKAFKVSPIKVETFIKETFGGVGAQALNALDQALATGGLIPRDQIGGESVFEATVRRFKKATGGEAERRNQKK